MEFRWVAIIALWTLISGPIIGVPHVSTSARSGKSVKIVKPSKPWSHRR